MPRLTALRFRALVPLAPLALIACGSNATSNETSEPDGGSVDDGSIADDSSLGDDGAMSEAGDTTPDATVTQTDAGSHPHDAAVPAHVCKRGVASDTAPTSAFAHSASSPGVTWWYDWATSVPAGATTVSGIAFVPMIWGTGALAGPIPSGSTYVLGFNEPNFSAQSNLTPAEAAADWPQVEALAKAAGSPIVSPAVNFCGSASDTSGCSDPSVTDPYTWLKDFFADCNGCEVDAIAVHWYNCDLPSLEAYIDGSSSLEGYVQFGKPIWLTEFSCDGSHSVADQTSYMQAAVPYLEANLNVARYSWFSASPIPNAQLANADGSPTALGTTYTSLAGNCGP